MPKTASDKAREIVWQKLSYAYKTLSQQAIEQNFFTLMDVADPTDKVSDRIMRDTLFSSIMAITLLGINPIEVVPWRLTWDVELPTPEEYSKGILIKLTPIDISVKYPYLADWVETMFNTYTPDKAVALTGAKMEKAYYGKSLYGASYYDPPPLHMFLRSTMFALMKKDKDLETVRREFIAIGKVLNLPTEFIEDMFRRLQLMTNIKVGAATWDYGYWDLTSLSEEGSGGLVAYEEIDKTVKKIQYDRVDHVLSGTAWDASLWNYTYIDSPENPFLKIASYWDEAYWDYSYWMPSERVPGEELPPVAMAVEDVIFNFRSRLVTTALAVANYQTMEERLKPERSWRTDQFGESRILVSRIEDKVESLINSIDPNMSVIKRRMYKVAALKLYSDLTSSRWGKELYKAMDYDTLKGMWVEEWSAKGLDRDVLTKIWDDVWECVRSTASQKLKSSVRAYLYRVK